MSITHSLAQLQKEHVVLELEFNGVHRPNVPQRLCASVTSEGGIAAFCRGYLGHRFVSTKKVLEMTTRLV